MCIRDRRELVEGLVKRGDARLLAAYDVYVDSQDVDDLVDTILRVARRDAELDAELLRAQAESDAAQQQLDYLLGKTGDAGGDTYAIPNDQAVVRRGSPTTHASAADTQSVISSESGRAP